MLSLQCALVLKLTLRTSTFLLQAINTRLCELRLGQVWTIPTEFGDIPHDRALVERIIVELLCGLKSSLTYLDLHNQMNEAVAAAVYNLPHLKHAVQSADVPSVLCPRLRVETLDLGGARPAADSSAERMSQVYPALQRLDLIFWSQMDGILQTNCLAFAAVTGLTALRIILSMLPGNATPDAIELADAVQPLRWLRTLVMRFRPVTAPAMPWQQQLRAALPWHVQLQFVHQKQDCEHVGPIQFRVRPGTQ